MAWWGDSSGIFLLAIEAGLPIVPVAIDGTRRVMRKGGLTTCPGEVIVEVFDPIDTAGLQADDARTLAERVRHTIAGVIVPDRQVPDVATGDVQPGNLSESSKQATS
jgi:1-acyl-sn-glycerol-3-phosphate acyltransferase